jgi:hypothetical protein
MRFVPSSPHSEGPALTDAEKVALRDVSKHRAVDMPMLRRLKELGLAELKSGVWSTTQQGQVVVMFGSAR